MSLARRARILFAVAIPVALVVLLLLSILDVELSDVVWLRVAAGALVAGWIAVGVAERRWRRRLDQGFPPDGEPPAGPIVS